MRGDTSHVNRTIAASELYSDQDIQDAMTIVVKAFRREFRGCTLTDLWYDEGVSVSAADEWAKQYDADEAIVLLSNFDTGSAKNSSWNPNETYQNWQWVLVRNEDGKWELRTWGYA